MCGSGTFALEAAHILQDILPGSARGFAFQNWPVYSEANFNYLKQELSTQKKSSAEKKIKIYASDKDPQALEVARKNIEANNLHTAIELAEKDFFQLAQSDFGEQKILLVMNPPYGKRLAGDEKTADFYRRIGNKIKKDFPEAGFAIIVPGLELEKALGLAYDCKLLFMNGGIKVAVLIKF
jgi:putative N6-adenine-specific DNA methylase